MKILHITRQFYPCVGGVENFVLNLAQKQTEYDCVVTVLTLNKSFFDKSVFPNEQVYKGIKIKRIPFWGIRRYPVALFCLKHLEDSDVIHIHCVDFFVDYLVLLKVFHRKKIILHTHGGFFHTRWFSVFKKIYFNIITRLVLRGCNKIIADSKHDYDLFRNLSKNIVRIDNGVDVDKYSGIIKNIDKGLLLYVGRIDEHKGIEDLINTTAVLIKRGFDVNLKIAGPDWKGIKPRLLDLTEELKIEQYVHFLGKVTDDILLLEMSKANLFVSASKYEAFGISAVEAMASGTPCVLNNIDSFRLFLSGPNCGLLTDFSNPEEAADSIQKILNMDTEQYSILCENARENAKQYSWNLVSKRIFSVYEEVIKNNNHIF